ncbi:MAG: UDP-N-acetylmuramate--alanine ligase [Alphaproteobacteria bacterium]|nr:UDP-N-acetylmuramate--alanine ligase [Alphaproteobacteria bacterium]
MTKIAFCGAAGNGISPLEQIMIKKGYEVYGSDRSFDEGLNQDRLEALSSVGLKIIPQNGSGITPDISCVYASAALDETNPDIKAARQQNIPVKSRSDLLSELFSEYSKGIAVGGTAGKTTTTAMIGYILDTLGYRPTMINGGMLCNYKDNPGLANYLYNDSEYCVIEADESDGSIRKYHPFIGVVNNISHDHTSIEKLVEYFTSFASHITGALVVNHDCPRASQLQTSARKITYSVGNPQADIYATDVHATENGICYALDGQTYNLNLIGKFNVSNALAAISACTILGIDKFAAAHALESFSGVKVRLEKIGTSKGVTVYNDFAHNPSKIEASLLALKDHPGRIIAMYQPHTPFSAVNTGDEVAAAVAKVLSPNDIMIMQEIYELTPQDVGISSANIINRIKENGHNNALFLPHKEDTRNFVIQNAKKGDRIVIMGAHDNSLADFSRELLKAI